MGQIYSDIWYLLRLLLALLPKSVWNIAISVHFDFKTVLHLTPIYLYDTHEFKSAWKFGVKIWKCTMHIWLASLTQIFDIYSDISNLLRLLLALLPKSVWNEAISVHFDSKILLNLSEKHLHDTHTSSSWPESLV